MPGGIEWFRWHHGSVSDPKLQLVAKKASASVAEVIAVWACVLESASQSVPRGFVVAPDFESLDCALGLPDGKTQEIYTRMQERGLIGADGSVIAWHRRQPKREREDDHSTDRVQAFRDRKRHETPRNANADTETPRGEERREEGISVPDGTGAQAPGADAIWDTGLQYLVAKGCKERGARGFLGKMRQAVGDLEAAELLAKAQAQDVSDPVAWLRAAARRRQNEGRTASGVAL